MADARDAFDGWNRKWRTLWCWSQLYLGYKAAQARGRMMSAEQRQEFWEQKHSHLAERMWSNIAELRGWWVKVGQFLSTRSDVLPVQYVHHLTKLQDMMPTSEYSVIKKIVEDELGRPISEVFGSFEEKAIASASIGQVHKATLKDGTQVVVKVQHPGVDKTLSQDMMTLTQMSWAFGLLEKGLNFGPILVEWQKSAANELDFRIELGFQQRAREASARSGIDVIIPECYPELTTKKVMVMEFCEGFKITDSEKLKEYDVDTDLLMNKICKSFAYQIHVDGMFNGDPHPGNILVQVDKNTRVAHPVLLDWGLVKMFSDSERIAFAKTVYSVANMDVMGLMAAFEDMGFRFKSDSVIDPELYMDALRIGFFRDTGSDSSMEQESAVDIAKDSGVNKNSVMEKNPIDDWPKDIIFFIRVASLLHGLSLQLNAKIPFLQLLVDKAEQCLLERYIPPSPLVYIRYPPTPNGFIRSTLEWKVHRLLCDLLERRHLLLGCQVAVVHEGRLIVDTCVGRVGPINTRPVQRDSLFCIMTVCNGLLATALLKLIDSGDLTLEEPVCHSWDGFIRFGKHNITVEQALTHRAGLHRALPKDLTLTKLTDYDKMISILEDATPESPMGEEGGRYAYLSSGWIFSEIIRGVVNQRIDEYFKQYFISKLGLGAEMFYPVPYALVKVATEADKKMADETSSELHSNGTDQAEVVVSSGVQQLALTNSESLSLDVQVSPEISRQKGEASAQTQAISSATTDAGAKSAGGYIFELDLNQILRAQSGTRHLVEPPRDEKPPSLNLYKRLSATPDIGESERPSRSSSTERLKQQPSEMPTFYPYSPIGSSVRDFTFSQRPTAESNTDQMHDSGLSTIERPPAPHEISAWLLGARVRSPRSVVSPQRSFLEQSQDILGNGAVQITRTPRKHHVKGADILSRFTSSRREIGVARISNKEVMDKLNTAKRAAQKHKRISTGDGPQKFKSKYLTKLAGRTSESDDPQRGSAIELAKAKPHVLDPLIYDSRRLHHLLIPPTNCRSTARALARFYGQLAIGKLISKQLLEKASQVRTVDSTLDALILTGGGSRLWGLGYQLYPTVRIPEPYPVTLSPAVDSIPRRVAFRESSSAQPGKKSMKWDMNDNSNNIVMGLGHGDLGGSVALCFPELKLGISILLNDILNGPMASQEILTFILNCFGLHPAWNIPYPTSQALDDINTTIREKVIAQRPSAAALKRERQYHIHHVVQSTSLPSM